MQVKVKYKGIVHNVLNDAPFIGAIIIAHACHRNCPNCINEHLKKDIIEKSDSASKILDTVSENGLNQGIILSGLEWTEQPDELRALVTEALDRGLEVMVYTHHEEETFMAFFSEFEGKPIYVKFGDYNEKLLDANHYSYGVKLASSNQYIKHLL